MKKITCAYSSLSCIMEGQSSNLVVNQGCLKTNPEERLTIDQVIQNKWVSVSEYFSSLSSTILQVNISKWRLKPLGALSILAEDNVTDIQGCHSVANVIPRGDSANQSKTTTFVFSPSFQGDDNKSRAQLNKSSFCSNTTRFRRRRC